MITQILQLVGTRVHGVLRMAAIGGLLSVAAWGQFTIVPNPASPPQGTRGTSYSGLGFTVTGIPVAPATNFRVTLNSLPPGLSIDSATGNITGMPTAIGEFTFQVSVDDSATPTPATAVSNNITIIVVNPPLSIITTSPLAPGVAGTPYSATIEGSGGTGTNLNLAVTDPGNLPPGITATPQPANNLLALAGTPTTPGPYTFNVTLDDTDPATPPQSQEFTIVIAAAPLTLSYPPTVNGTRGTPLAPVSPTRSGGTPDYSYVVTTETLPDGVQIDPSTGIISGTPLVAASPTIRITVTDSTSPTPQTATSGDIAISIVNPPLQITTGSPLAEGVEGVAYTQNIVATGGDGTAYNWQILTGSLPPGLTLSTATGATAVISGTPDPSSAGAYPFTLEVNDSDPATDPVQKQFTITVIAGLTITTTSPLPAAPAGTAYNQTISAAGGDGSYSWTLQSGTLPPGLTLPSPATGSTIALIGTPLAAGTYLFTLEVDDTNSNTGAVSKEFSLSVSPVITNLNPSSRDAGNADLVLQIVGFGFVAGSTSVSFGSTQIGIGAVGVVGGTPGNPVTTATLTVPGAALVTPGPPPVSVVVTANDVPSNSADFAVIGDTTISITNESNLGTRTAGTDFSVDLDATGGNGNYTWSVAAGSSLPPGLALNAGSGLLSGTLTQAGTFSFTIRVVDDASPGQSSGQKTFNLVVQDFVISTTSLPQARVGIAYSAPLSLAGGPTSVPSDYQWTLVSSSASLPGGISFNSTTGTFSGIPDAIGSPSQVFSVQVSARHQPTGLVTPVRTLQLTVTGGGLDISVNTLPVGVVNQPYGPTGTGVRILPVNGTAPYTMTISAASVNQLNAAGFNNVVSQSSGINPALSISGTPTIPGSFPVVVTVNDSGNTQVQRTLTLLVLANPLSIQPETLPTATVDVDYSQQLTATGLSPEEQQNLPPGGSAVQWALLSNVPGLNLNATTGLLTGRFTTSGPRQFILRATTSLRSVDRQYILSVEAPRPTISTTSLPLGTVGQSYSAEVTATGGTPGYTWLVAGVTLPSGLSFDAGTVNSASLRISGTPASGSQSRTFTLIVRDANGQTGSREFTLSITSTPIPSISLQPFQNPVPAEQKDVVLTLAQTYPIALQGTATLTFTPNATNNADDPAVQFLSGGRTAAFTIPANTTQAVFSGVSGQRAQTGTVAGTIRVDAAIAGGGPSTLQEFSIARSAPFLQDTLTLQSSGNGFSVQITGYSTPRDLTSAQVTFTPTSGTNLQTTQLTIPLTDAATQWFQSGTGQGNGSAFKLTIPFTVQGGTNAVASVTLTLTNSVGTSNSRSRSF